MEINQRVNYPVKEALNALVELEQLDMSDSTVKFCFSWITMRVCQAGIESCVQAWNHLITYSSVGSLLCYHPFVNGDRPLIVHLDRGSPIDRIQMSQTIVLRDLDIPTLDDAVTSF